MIWLKHFFPNLFYSTVLRRNHQCIIFKFLNICHSFTDASFYTFVLAVLFFSTPFPKES